MSMKIFAVCKDRGGTDSVVPVVQELRKSGDEVLLFTNGLASSLLVNADNIPVTSANEVISKHGLPDILISSMCSGGGVGWDLVLIMRNEKPDARVITITNGWSGAQLNAWADKQYWPDLVCVNDWYERREIEETWQDYSGEIIETGWPALDSFVNYDQRADRVRMREELDIPEDAKVILWAGQIKNTGLALSELVTALNKVSAPDVYLIAREHSRLRSDNEFGPAEIEQSNQALAKLHGAKLIDGGQKEEPREIIATSDIVLSINSFALVEAAIMHKETIAIQYPNIYDLKTEFPLVALGACERARDQESLHALLTHALNPGLGQGPAQSRAFKIDGQNAKRTANAILNQ
ncbi:MAG TPA: CDP-glycerol glycerophosphotransferase family protein [Candidatus Paceibacterota bacterium]